MARCFANRECGELAGPVIVTAAANDGRVVSTPPSAASRDDGVPCVRLASRLTTYVSCSVHAGASRHVHYPSLNACLIHQGRSRGFQCRTVHFGYAIPVIVHRHHWTINAKARHSCEIVLDSHATLEPATASYLLEQHPDLVAIGATLRNRKASVSAAAADGPQAVIQAAKLAAFKSVEVRTHHRSGSQTPLIQPDVSSSSKMAVDPNELYDQLMRQNSAEQDIQAIAKQISDHAEAIYQTWKSKGLTPNELLHLHSTETTEGPADVATAPAFRQMRTSSSMDRRSASERPKSGSSLSPVELLASPQLDATLEQLVNSFVHEDKARLAARARTVSPSPAGVQQPTSAVASTIQTALKRFEMKGLNYESARGSSNRVTQSEPPAADVTVRSSPSFQEAVQSSNRTSPGQQAAEQPSGTVKSRAQRFATRIELANASHVSPSWPVKRAVSPGPVQYHKVTVVAEVAAHNPVAATAAAPKSASNTSEVDKEEEKLINALKTGRVIDEVAVPNSPASSDHFHQSLIKKTRERHQRVAPTARTGSAEEELESLVGRLKITEPTPSRSATSVSRENSPGPITLAIRDGSPARSTSPRSVKLSETVPVAGVSTVDYAKVRYQAAQANPLTQQRLEDSRTIGKAQNSPQPNVVSETRSRFEGSTRPAVNTCAVPWRSGVQINEWSPVRPPASVDPADEFQASAQHSQSAGNSGLNLEALRRMKTRKMRKSPEPQPTGCGSNTTSPTSSPLPHPELTVQQKQHLRERNLQQHGAGGHHHATSVGLPVQYTSTGIPIRPFLTRGSVAERVLIFEKCPTTIMTESATKSDKVTSAATAATAEKSKRAGSPAPQPWRHSNDVQTRVQGYAKDNNKENRSTSTTNISSPRSTLRRQAKANNNLLLPRFYYPTGRPISKEQLDASLLRLAAAFQQLPNCQASREHFGTIAKACGCPYYWKAILFIASGGEKLGHVTLETFTDFWGKIINNYHDEASRFVQLLTMINMNVTVSRTDSNLNTSMNNGAGSGRFYLIPEDFVPLVQDVVDTHPGLTFLKEAAEFHSRYVHTVIARIYYNVNRSWSGHITLTELRHSNLLATIRLLEEEEDINQITDYFSYEHFYVIYCKFWELDKDHDLFIDKKDLARHNDHALSSKMIDRIFSGAVTRGVPHNNRMVKFGNTNTNMNNQPRMSYTEFVWFLISEEDKRHSTAIEYWFRCMDLDGDGFISMYELEYFYEEQLQRMESLGIETLPFEDCLCQMLDMIHPAVPGKISLNDLKRCQMTPIFFDTFFNLEKYLDHEQRDPFASQRDPDSENGDEILKISDWDRYAAEEYELLVAEEGGPDHGEDMFMREEMTTGEEDGNDHSSLPLSMERDVIMADSDVNDGHDDYSALSVHSSLGLGNAGHRSLFSVTPCSIEYQY